MGYINRAISKTWDNMFHALSRSTRFQRDFPPRERNGKFRTSFVIDAVSLFIFPRIRELAVKEDEASADLNGSQEHRVRIPLPDSRPLNRSRIVNRKMYI